jgi:hypothetical protein
LLRIEQDERLAAFQRFQKRQERNDHIVEQLVQQIEQLTELVINQQQHARETKALHQLVNRSFEASSDAQQHQASYFDLNTFKDLIQMIVLLCTLLVLLKD